VERVADIVAIVHRGKLLVVERLDELKRTARQVAITLTDAGVPPPSVGGRLIYQRRHGRQWEYLVRDCDESA
jgi:ABC-2 type transport system ATP-binding protein